MLFSAVVLLSAFGPLVYLSVTAPAGTGYRFADGFFTDYYHYLMKIKSGMMGHFGYYNRYTEIPQPETYGHMIFPLMGYAAAFLGIVRTDIVYLLSRLVTLVVLFFIWYRACDTDSFERNSQNYCTHILFCRYGYVRGYPDGRRMAGSGNGYVYRVLYALSKFPVHPQHLIASAGLLGIAYVLAGNSWTRRRSIVLVVILAVTGMYSRLWL